MKPEIKNFNTDLSLEDIKDFEKKHNLKLPEDYIDFILEFNGGSPYPYHFKYEDKNTKKIEYILIEEFDSFPPYIIGYNEEWNVPKNCIVISCDGHDCIFISLNKEDYGKIYITDYFINTEKLKANLFSLEHMLLANSFTEFINNFELPENYHD